MASEYPHFIKQWRLHRKLSQDKLVELLRERLEEGFSKASLSRIENFKQPYSEYILEALAWALKCHPAELLVRDPREDNPVWSIMDNLKRATPEQQVQVKRVTDALIPV